MRNKNFNHLCPLCNARSINTVDSFSSRVLIDLYKKSYDFDISYLFRNIKKIELKKCNECSLIYFYPNISGDEKFYQRLQKNVKNYYYEDKFEYQVVKKYFSNESDVLEIGAGKGAFSKIIPYKTYTGLEFSESAIQIAKEKGITLYNKKIQAYASNNNINKNFDIIASFQVLEHVELQELRSFIDSSLQLLKKGGKFIVCVPSNSSFVGGIPNMPLNLPPHHITRWSDETFKKMEKIFPVKIVYVYYEPLKLINYNAFISWRFFNILRVQRKIIEDSKLLILRDKVINKIIKHLPKKVKSDIIKKEVPRGHSIIVVYEKS